MTTILGSISPADFLRNHWQQKPLLIHGALPDYISPITPDELAGLALEEEVESRLVTHFNNIYQVEHGPLQESLFSKLPEENWTLMVQRVDQLVPQVSELFDEFAFLPPWRFDDIMVSYATAGGGVGPHFDYYDVFLLQVEGRREWKIGQLCNGSTPLADSDQLKLLKDFDEQESWVLVPGDMLYLPPNIAHWGTAVDECLTYSVGFRAPTVAEILGDLAIELTSGEDDRYYRDPPLTPEMARDEVDDAFVEGIQKLLFDVVGNKDVIRAWLQQYNERRD